MDLPILDNEVLSYPIISDSEVNKNGDTFTVTANFGVERIFELGRKGPLYRHVNYPVEYSMSRATGCA